MMDTLKIGTWNLFLGLSNKKETVTRYLNACKIDVCCLQETEIPSGFPENTLNCDNYNVELENNTVKKELASTSIKTLATSGEPT